MSVSVAVRWGRFFFGRRDLVFAAVFLGIAAVSRPLPFAGSLTRDVWLDVFGLGVILSGQALRVLVIGLAYIRRGGKDGKIHADELVVDGLFAHCRNPLYAGNLLVYAGLFLILNSTAGYLVGVPFFLVAYRCITAAEEEYLGRRFGSVYADYCRRVPRFVPDLRGLPATIRRMRFRWKRVVRKEYGATNAWMMVALGLIVYEQVAWQGFAASAPVIRRASIGYAVLLAIYLTARWLKKTHRLDDA